MTEAQRLADGFELLNDEDEEDEAPDWGSDRRQNGRSNSWLRNPRDYSSPNSLTIFALRD